MSSCCIVCNKNENDQNNLVSCDSCNRVLHKKDCSGLNSSEIRVMELKGPRQLKFFCKDCHEGFRQVPKLIALVGELQKEVEKLKSASPASCSHEHSDGNPVNEEEMLIEFQDRQKRSNNVMLFNIPEGNDDKEEVSNIFSSLVSSPPEILHLSRVGKRNVNNARSLKVVLPSSLDVLNIVKNRSKLKGRRIYVNFDLTPKQREAERTLYTQLKNRREKGEKNLSVRYRNGIPHIIQKN